MARVEKVQHMISLPLKLIGERSKRVGTSREAMERHNEALFCSPCDSSNGLTLRTQRSVVLDRVTDVLVERSRGLTRAQKTVRLGSSHSQADRETYHSQNPHSLHLPNQCTCHSRAPLLVYTVGIACNRLLYFTSTQITSALMTGQPARSLTRLEAMSA